MQMKQKKHTLLRVVSVWYRPIGEIRQQDKMTTAQIYSNNNNQFPGCVYKAYIKWLGMLLPGCGPMVERGLTSSFF